jgi:hypothetical protein
LAHDVSPFWIGQPSGLPGLLYSPHIVNVHPSDAS